MTIRKLTQEEINELKSMHKSNRDRRVCDRIKAVLMYDNSHTLEEIAKALLLSHECVRLHLKDYHDNNKLKTNNGGSKTKLYASQMLELSAHLEVNNYVTVRDINNYIEQKYAVKYTISATTNLLKRLGFVYKKPKLVPGKLDLDKQEHFKLQYHSLKSNLKSDEAIFFMDAVHPQYQAKAKSGWIKKDQVKTLPTTSGWKRKHIIGAINLQDFQLINSDNPKINSDYIIEFLKKLEKNTLNKEKIYLICDNASYNKSKKVKDYIQNSKIELLFLPPYSPNLNPIERLWKFMHSVTTKNRYYHNFLQFSKKLDEFFENISKYRHELKSLITDNFQKIVINHFNSST